MDAVLDKGKLRKSMDRLQATLINKCALSRQQLQDTGFDAFYKKAIHHASGGGLTIKTTGISIVDPLLPNEAGNFGDQLKKHPVLKGLNTAVKQFEEKLVFNDSKNKHKALEFVATIGSEGDINSTSLYASIFTSYRKAVLTENDGLLRMPNQLEDIARATIKMLNEFSNNVNCSNLDRKQIIKAY